MILSQRGRLTSLKEKVEDKCKKNCMVHCSIEATDADETSVHAIIEKVKSIITASEEEKAAMTVENFHAALKEQVTSQRYTKIGPSSQAEF